MAPQRPYGHQCPRCGGNDFTEKFESTGGRFFTVTIDPANAGCMASTFFLFSLIGIGMAAFGVVNVIKTQVDIFTGGFAAIFGTLITICCIGWAFSSLNAGVEPGKYKYKCRLCYNAWILRPGESWPKVHDRPDLVAAGRQRLEREQKQVEERRRQEERAKAEQFRRFVEHEHFHRQKSK